MLALSLSLLPESGSKDQCLWGVSPQAPVNVAKCVTRRTSLDRVSKQTLTAGAKTTVKLNNFKTDHSKVQGVVTNYTCGHRPIYMYKDGNEHAQRAYMHKCTKNAV